jgi:5-formyltetrahydrofolate cyclo-ligase
VALTRPQSDDKPRLRGEARARRDAFDAASRAAAADAIAARVDAEVLAPLPAGAVVCLYDAIGSEVPTRAIAARAVARGLALAYPRVVAGTLELALHRAAPEALVPGTWNILEPPPDAPALRPDQIAVVLLPGLAFDHRGARLGWGRGHYDATFAAAPDRLRVGLAFEAQLVEHLPTDPHDLFVHLIVTEAAVHRCAAG